MAQLVEYEKKFVIIGNMNAITYKEIFPLLKENIIWLGYTHPKIFLQPDGSEKSFGNIHWYTNLDIKKRHEFLDLHGNYYDSVSYPKYDNYDAIEVSKVSDIPCDYDGVMGVPITFLNYYNPLQFEILDMAHRGAGTYKYRTKVYDKNQYVNASDLNATAVYILSDGTPKNVYFRMLIRRK